MSRQSEFDRNRNMEYEQMAQQLEEAARQLQERNAQIAQLQEQNIAAQQINALQQQMQNLVLEMQSRDALIANLQNQARPNSEIDRCLKDSQIPDTIKQLPTYNGDAKLLATWIDSVDRVLALYVNVRHTESYNIWLSQIRNKITDRANEALLKNHTPLVWENIKETLKSYFGDKRDLSTLTGKIPYLRQKNRTLDDYYHEVEGLFADINANIHLDPENAGHEAAIMKVLEVSIRNAFIDGLRENLGTYTRSGRPKDLLQAYQIAKDYDNAEERRKEKFQQYHKSPQNNATNPRYGSIHPNVGLMNSYNRPPPVPQRKFPKVEHMEVDPSVRINYMNRPRPTNSLNTRQNQTPSTQFRRAFGNQQPINFRANAPQQPRFHVEELTNTDHDVAQYQDQNYVDQNDHHPEIQTHEESDFENSAENVNIDDLNFHQASERQETT